MKEVENIEFWISQIEPLVTKSGLSCYPQEFIVCSKDQMIEKQAHYGGYQLYPLWKFGKNFFINKELLNRNFFFLPYEIVINTDPCKAYLLAENAIFQNICIISHVYGHNDFFKNNELFTKNNPAMVEKNLERHCRLIEKYITDPQIGFTRVEETLEAAHSIMFLETEEGTLLDFIAHKAVWLEPWKLDLIDAVDHLAKHLMPVMKTKIMNEGWATYWHHRILQKLAPEIKEKLSYEEYFKAHQFHLNVIRLPNNPRQINPYRVGFYVWEKLAKERGDQYIFEVRKNATDFTFLLDHFCNNEELVYQKFVRPLLVQEFLKENPDQNSDNLSFLEEKGLNFRQYREIVLEAVRSAAGPKFSVFTERAGNKRKLVLNHLYDGRYLKMTHIYGALKLIHVLWGMPIQLNTKTQKKTQRMGLTQPEIKEEDCTFTFYSDGKMTRNE